MLSLAMKRGDYLMLGGNVRLTFDRSKGAAEVYFAVDAPREIRVLRGEVYERQLVEAAEARNDVVALERIRSDKALRQQQLERRRERRALAQAAREAAKQAERESGKIEALVLAGDALC